MRIVNGPNSHDLSTGDHSPHCSVLWVGGGLLINVPSVPTVTRTVNGPKNLDHFPSGPTFASTENRPNSLDFQIAFHPLPVVL